MPKGPWKSRAVSSRLGLLAEPTLSSDATEGKLTMSLDYKVTIWFATVTSWITRDLEAMFGPIIGRGLLLYGTRTDRIRAAPKDSARSVLALATARRSVRDARRGLVPGRRTTT